MSKRSCTMLLLGALATGCATSGKPAPGAEAPTQATAALAPMQERFPALEKRPSGLEVVARLEDTPPGNVAITPEGRIFLSQHPFGSPRYAVVELLPDGTTRPYPTEPWASPPEPEGDKGLRTVIGLESDPHGVLWILDNGRGAGEGAKLLAWDTRQETLVKNLPLKEGAAPNSFLQDLVVDPSRNVAVLADMGRGDLIGENMPALVVVDLESGKARRVLEGHPSLQPEDVSLVVEGRTITVENPEGEQVEPRLGLNPIALDPRSEWVYYGAMNGRTVYRVPLAALKDESLSAEELGAKVERYGEKAVSDGISIDQEGNVYVTDLGANAIGVTQPSGEYRVLVQDELLKWPDGISYAPDGHFYVTVNQLHRHAVLNQGRDATQPPFLLVRFRPLAPSEVGR